MQFLQGSHIQWSSYSESLILNSSMLSIINAYEIKKKDSSFQASKIETLNYLLLNTIIKLFIPHKRLF